ncbi:MAG: DMT family transporter [Chitinophagales bacterium]|nr:DMT family transporter [Sphingobacteriales bacterium]
MEKIKISPIQWLTLILLGTIWGSSFILMKIGTRSFSTIELSVLRMFFGGCLALPFLFSILKKYDKKILFWMLVSSLLGSGIPSLFYAYSASRMDSNLNGVINSLTPLFTLIVGIIWLKYKTSLLSLIGIFIGFFGVLMLFTQKNTTFTQAQYAVFPLLATMMYGINMNIVKVKLSHLPSIDILKGVFGILGWLSLPIALYLGVLNDLDFSQCSFNFWVSNSDTTIQKMKSIEAMFILGFIGSFIASLVFYRLLKQTNALFASTNTYLIPLMSIFWGFMDGEMITWVHFASLLIILFGVYLVGKNR